MRSGVEMHGESSRFCNRQRGKMCSDCDGLGFGKQGQPWGSGRASSVGAEMGLDARVAHVSC